MPQVLLVEDNRAEAELLDEYLQLYGMDVQRVSDGSFALEALRRPPASRFDGLVLDLNLPVVSGYEILRILKREPRLRPRRVIVTSHSNGATAVEVCKYMGADAFVEKNDDPVVFANNLWNALAPAES
jgi:CheY-like chemotaxis protein